MEAGFVMGIQIEVHSPVRGVLLSPHYDADADILSVTSGSQIDWPYGIDIDGNLVFDLDAQRRLVNFDLHIPRRLWSRAKLKEWPRSSIAGNLAFSKQAIDQKSFNTPINVMHDKEQGILSIGIGSEQRDRVIEISKSCIALLHQSELVGFLVKLPN
jgi:hypothetical protein